ncbi:hypothetical protein GCM10011391_11720 [Pullulanibacillus camelliae]|uniref:histidine kinase n=1 Tax=Pullulanibacillus camelliae TaxID=1707096 RepID=A0A8J2VNG7_9BACL|nr:ATP-binding protein [Pullulanibacillus camelliae]GGE34756.1 hypothetical protein GCM10011391_11720 [Pullulanibacillus camelliae]
MITHSLDGNDVVVTIRDTGKGIEEDKIERLGTPFYTTKAQGTGMGLTQAFSVMYQHGGEIKVESKLNQGTTFIIRLPQHKQIKKRGLRKMDLRFHDGDSLKDFFLKNKEEFEEKLLAEAINVRDKIDEIHTIGNINLVDNAHKLILFVIEERVQELIAFAKQEGVSWSKYSLTLAFKLEWIQAIRRTLWTFLFNYDTLMDKELERGAFYSLEIQINDLIDQFLTHFFISYSKYKDELLERQREIAENLSVPIIPIHSQICVLPLIGRIDEQRISTILEKVLHEIEVRRIQTLIIDLSGALTIENAIAGHLIKITEGISMMGCQTVMTGLRAELVKGLIASGETFKGQVKFKGTLQMALADMFFKSDINSSEH